MIELLAPAGSREAFTAAVEAGANAVYLGGRAFGARHYAPNFDDDELAEVIREAHLRDVRVYVTVNTLVDNAEVPALISYLQQLYRLGVDAIIVQDVGVAAIARQVVPGLELHASTQMTVHNLAGVEFLAGLGFARVVLARELSLAEIREIAGKASIEIETFVHGALCISYSGQCLMSSMIGGRSGNRGKCAQPCRLPYTLVDANGNDVLKGADAGEYLLSPKDFNAIEHLPDLIEAGVVSFKIEGRMKRAEYVAIVVDSYRRAIDAYLANKTDFVVPVQDQKDMAQVFNRGFTTAYLYGKQGREMMSDRRPNNRGVRIGRVVDTNLRAKTAAVKLDEPLYIGDVVEFWVKVGGRSNVTVTAIQVNGKTVTNAEAGQVATIPVDMAVKPGDRLFKTYDSQLMEKAKTFFTGSAMRRIPLDVKVEVAAGKPLRISLVDDAGNRGEGRTTFIAEPAIKRPLTEETIAKQVGRVGTTVFAIRHSEYAIDGAVMVPVSEINEARRQAVEALEETRLAKFRRPGLPQVDYQAQVFMPERTEQPRQSPKLVVSVDTLGKVKTAFQAGADLVLFGGETYNHKPIGAEDYREAVAIARGRGKGIILATPRLVQEWQMEGLRGELELFRQLAPDAVSIGNLGSLQLARRVEGLKLHGDYSLNTFNSVAVRFFAEAGLTSLALSPELNFGQIEELAQRAPVELECLVHGYLALMVSEYCALGSFMGNLRGGRCSQPCLKGQYWLKDRLSETFRLVTDQYCRMHVLNAKELSMLPHVPKMAALGIARLRIEGKAADEDHIARITRLYRRALDSGDAGEAAEHENITRGHYFRGVL